MVLGGGWRDMFPSLNGSLDELAVDCSALRSRHLALAGPPMEPSDLGLRPCWIGNGHEQNGGIW